MKFLGRFFSSFGRRDERRSHLMRGLGKGMAVVGLAMIFMAGPVMSVHAAPITVRTVSAWSRAAQFETQQFLTFIDMIQKEADQEYPGQLVIDYKGAGEVIPTQQ